LFTNPAPARPSYVGTLLFCGSQAFFNSDVMACEEAPKCGAAAVDSVLAHRRNDLIQRQIRLLSDKSEYPLRMSLQRRNASSAWFWPRNALSLPVLQPSNCGTCADLQLLGGFPPRCSRFNKSNDSYSHFTGIRAAHGSPPKGESMRIDSLPTWPLGIPRFTHAGTCSSLYFHGSESP